MPAISTDPAGSDPANSRARRGWRLIVALALSASAMLAGCDASQPATPAGDPLLEITVPTQVTVQTRTLAGLGPVVVDSQGRSLYVFPPDARSRVTCTGPCAGTWPPLVIAKGDKPVAGVGVQAAGLGTLSDPNTGALIVTYGGYPLYRYAGDLTAGTADGQGLFLNGGPWYVINPDRQPVTTIPGQGA